jgi:3-oxoacyl-[acyl-carrier protein] reductase
MSQQRIAYVTGGMGGIGTAICRKLHQEGCLVIAGCGPSRDHAKWLAEQAQDGYDFHASVGNVGDWDSTKAAFDLVREKFGAPDILINNNGGPPLKDFRTLGRDAIVDGVVQNMVTPIELVQRVIDGMVVRRFGRIVNITSASVLTPISGLDLSSGARAGLTAFLAGVARDVAHANVTINSILPGMFDTDRIRSNFANAATRLNIPEDKVRADRIAGVPAKRLGEADEFGKLAAFLSSAHAGYITGQNLLIDGGAFRSAF